MCTPRARARFKSKLVAASSYSGSFLAAGPCLGCGPTTCGACSGFAEIPDFMPSLQLRNDSRAVPDTAPLQSALGPLDMMESAVKSSFVWPLSRLAPGNVLQDFVLVRLQCLPCEMERLARRDLCAHVSSTASMYGSCTVACVGLIQIVEDFQLWHLSQGTRVSTYESFNLRTDTKP